MLIEKIQREKCSLSSHALVFNPHKIKNKIVLLMQMKLKKKCKHLLKCLNNQLILFYQHILSFRIFFHSTNQNLNKIFSEDGQKWLSVEGARPGR